MKNLGLLLAVFCTVYSGLPIQAIEDNGLQELLDYGDYLDTDTGSGMDERNDTESNIRLIEIPTGNDCNKKNGKFACQL